MIVSEIISKATQLLRDSDIENARSEAELLTGFVLGWSRLQVMIRGELEVDDMQYAQLCTTIKRRALGEPFAYICGEKEFMSLVFKVTQDVLIPRPDTELLVETALEYLGDNLMHKGIVQQQVLDLCTGSGAIAVSIAYYFSNCSIIATDISEQALVVAQGNASLNDVPDRIKFLQGDLFEPIDDAGNEINKTHSFDCIISNPPYIPDRDISSLMRDVRDYEPRLALAGGGTGLDFYVRITEQALAHLNQAGMLAVEIGSDQGGAVQELFAKAGFKNIKLLTDLAGLPRVVSGIK